MDTTNRDDDTPPSQPSAHRASANPESAPQESALAELLVTYHQYLIDQSWQGSRAPLPDATMQPRVTNGEAETPQPSNPADSSLDDSLVTDPELAQKLAELEDCLWQLELHRRAKAAPPAIDGQDAAVQESKEPSAHTPALFDLAGKRIGRFELLRELGRGGLGVVFLARDPVLKRLVALKVPRGDSLPGAEARERFQREAQAAARLTHPHIVPVFEIGEVGPLSFIAAAYVPGQSLAEWLRERTSAVPIEEAARLVADLADAMQYAHAQGVLHRDLKPANVLLESSTNETTFQVGETASAPALSGKITDFGLAKLLDQVGHDTRSGVIVGTPAYMSPEQAEGLVNELGPATDIYSLGVILFELLAGEPPFRGKSDAATLARVVQGKTLSLRAVRADVPRDLEAICLKCLEQKPGDRYTTAGELADDLRRFCWGEATSARPLTAGQRLARWTRQNPVVATLSALSIVLLLSVATISTVAALRIRTARDEAQQTAIAEREAREQADRALLAEQEAVRKAQQAETAATEARTLAEQQAKNATQISSMLEELFTTADPLGMAKLGFRRADEVGMDLPLSELLKRGAERSRENLADQPLVLAAMLDTLGNVYSNLGQVKEAEPLIQDAYNLRMQHGASDADMATSKLHLGVLRHWQGSLDEGEPLLRDAFEARKRIYGVDALAVADAEFSLAWLMAMKANYFHFDQRGDYFREVDRLWEDVYRIRRAKLGAEDGNVGFVLMARASSLLARGDGNSAQQMMLEATQILMQQEGGDRISLLIADSLRAQLLVKQGNPSGALAVYERTLPQMREILGRSHFLVFAVAMETARLRLELGRRQESEALFRETIANIYEVIPNGSPLLMEPLGQAASNALHWGEVDLAEEYYRQEFELRRRFEGEEAARHEPFIMASVYIIAGRFDDASKLLREHPMSVEEASRNPNAAHQFSLCVHSQMELVHCLGNLDNAVILAPQLAALDIPEGPHTAHVVYLKHKLHPQVANEHLLTDTTGPVEEWLTAFSPKYHDPWKRVVLAKILVDKGLHDRIDDAYTRILNDLQGSPTPTLWLVAHAESVMGELRAAQGRNEEAERLLLSGLANLRKSRGEHHWLTREAASALVTFYKNTGREAETVSYEPLLQVPQLAFAVEFKPQGSPLFDIETLAWVSETQGDFNRAEELYRKHARMRLAAGARNTIWENLSIARTYIYSGRFDEAVALMRENKVTEQDVVDGVATGSASFLL
ncbi:MAG: protein kinase [Pirellulales bacterium]|nr:protein kinase [Pirellulales bacterium]